MKKNYFKFLSVLVMVCCISISFSACGSDDDDDNNGGSSDSSKLIGKWQMTEAKVNGKVQDPNSPSSHYEACDYKGYSLYKADGTYEDYDACEKTTTTGKWTLKDGKIVVTSSSFPIDMNVQIKELTDDKLVTYYEFVDKQELTFKKIK